MTDTELIRDHHKLLRLLKIAVNETLVVQGKRKSAISRTQAYIRYGEANVKYGVRTGAITPHKGSAKNSIEWYEVTQLELLKLQLS